MKTPQMIAVASSQIHSIGHDSETNTLHIYFPKREKGKIVGVGSHYTYANFTEEKFNQFMSAESKGIFFGENIKKLPEDHPYTRHEIEETK